MADQRITELTAIAAAAASDLLVLVDMSGTAITKKITFANLITSLASAIELLAQGTVNGRLTLLSATPLPTTDQTARPIIYFTPYLGNKVGLYNGTSWKLYTFTEKSISLAGMAANRNYDVFGYASAGTLVIEALAWTSDLARATALTTRDGVHVRADDVTRRYLGTFRTTATIGQCEDSEARRYVWNLYNQVQRHLFYTAIDIHIYNSATERAWNNNTAHRFQWVQGSAQSFMTNVCALSSTTSGTSTRVAAGLDVISGGDHRYGVVGQGVANAGSLVGDGGGNMVAPGFHFIQCLQTSSVTGTNTFFALILRGNFLA